MKTFLLKFISISYCILNNSHSFDLAQSDRPYKRTKLDIIQIADGCDSVETLNPVLTSGFNAVLDTGLDLISPIKPPKNKRINKPKNLDNNLHYTPNKSFQDDPFDASFEIQERENLSFNAFLSPNSKGRYKSGVANDASFRKEKRSEFFNEQTINRIDQMAQEIIYNKSLKTFSHLKKMLQKIAQNAAKAYTEKLNNDYRALGTYRHDYCAKFIKRLQYHGVAEFLQVETSYLKQNLVLNNPKGCARFDVLCPPKALNNNSSGYVFDFKFVRNSSENVQMNNPDWRKHLPKGNDYNLFFIVVDEEGTIECKQG